MRQDMVVVETSSLTLEEAAEAYRQALWDGLAAKLTLKAAREELERAQEAHRTALDAISTAAGRLQRIAQGDALDGGDTWDW